MAGTDYTTQVVREVSKTLASALRAGLRAGLSPEQLGDPQTWGRRITALDGMIVYPTWQFRADGSAIPHLRETLEALAEGSQDPWVWALWMSAPAPLSSRGTGRRSEHECRPLLAEGNDPGPVLAAARADAAQWSQ